MKPTKPTTEWEKFEMVATSFMIGIFVGVSLCLGVAYL
jgi:hypothetical protein